MDYFWWFEWLRKKRISRLTKGVINKNSKVLDLGCGDDFILRTLDVDGIGIDINLNYFPSNDSRNTYFLGDITAPLPFKPSTFDYCIMSHVIEHLSPLVIEEVLNECKRILKSKGKIIIMTPTPLSDGVITCLYKLHFFDGFNHEIYFTKDGLQKLCSDIGFKVYDICYYNLWLGIIYIGEKP